MKTVILLFQWKVLTAEAVNVKKVTGKLFLKAFVKISLIFFCFLLWWLRNQDLCM